MRFWIFALSLILLSACGSSPSSTSPTDGMEKREGLFDLYVDADEARILAQLPEAGDGGILLRVIHTARLTAGMGSNPVGLDRGWGNGGQILVFRKIGDVVILEVENLTYRASMDNPLEGRAVRESFATSFIASADIIASDDGILIDLTDFLTSDVLNLVQYLKDAGQGNFKVAEDRTLVDTGNTFAFPDNVEFDVFFTLSSVDPGREVSTTAANGRDVTLIQHHSFVRLPDDGYTPLPSDPRVGVIERVHYDYSAPLSAPIETRFARRYRLQKNEAGETIKPIVYYIDSGAPEPIRSALVDGASWWKEAFEAAGYPDGFRVEILPEDAHPLDVRYNVVQWVHRQTRGWSYGGGVSDPRTGEMIKGHVNLGSLRVRQDRMIFEGLAGTAKTDSGDDDDPVELALDRIRQLAAHEVGHPLGFAHNFAASTYGKASVMDYPAPDIRVLEGRLDFSQAYGVGVGDWDKFTTAWLYGDLDEAARQALVEDMLARGMTYVADSDGRSVATGHPMGNIWDNGPDPVAALEETLIVRDIALASFGVDRILPGQPVSDLNKVIVPIYLYHRYQTAAAAKVIGGMRFNYGLRGDLQPAAEIVPASEQRAALSAVLKTISPSALDLADETLALLTPSIGSSVAADPNRELFSRTAYPAFDVLSAAGTSADMTFAALLAPRRAARLVEFNRRDPGHMGLDEMLATIRSTVMAESTLGRTGEIAKMVQSRYAFALMELASADISSSVRVHASTALDNLAADLRQSGGDHAVWLARQIADYQARPEIADVIIEHAEPLPPGGPIGMEAFETCWHCDPIVQQRAPR